MSQHKESFCTSTYHYEPEMMDNTPGLKRVAAYCRVSTLTEQQELSFETQCSFYRELIEKDPTMKLVGIYGDQGLSGLRSASRKEFLRLIRDCEKGKVDLILTQKVSNVTKRIEEIILCSRLLAAQPHPIGIYFISEDLFTLASYYREDLKDVEFLPSPDWQLLPDDIAAGESRE